MNNGEKHEVYAFTKMWNEQGGNKISFLPCKLLRKLEKMNITKSLWYEALCRYFSLLKLKKLHNHAVLKGVALNIFPWVILVQVASLYYTFASMILGSSYFKHILKIPQRMWDAQS